MAACWYMLTTSSLDGKTAAQALVTVAQRQGVEFVGGV